MTKIFFGLPIGKNHSSHIEQIKSDNPDASVFIMKEKSNVYFSCDPFSSCAIFDVEYFVGYEMPKGKDCVLKGIDTDDPDMLWTLTFDEENLCTNISFKGYK